MWHKNIEEVYKKLSSSQGGLTTKESKSIIEKKGLNVLPRKKKDSFLKLFFLGFFEPMEILLIISMAFSFFIGEIVDGLALFFIIIVDVLLGSFEEWKANKNADALASLIKVNVLVLRDGKKTLIDSEYLVPGDIIYLFSGDKISADARIIECENFTVDESTLTGESVSILKNNLVLDEKTPLSERTNMVFASSSVLTGRATCIVVATGVDTEVGLITEKVINTKEPPSPLTIRINKLTKEITFLIVAIASIITIVLFLKGYEFNAIILSVIALSVSAMPEGLSLALTMALTIASNRMSKKNCLVKKLNAVESLGSSTVIASDKTGTLTVNEQTAKKIVLPDNTILEIEGTGYNDIGRVIGNNLEEAKILSKMCVINNEANLEEKDGTFTNSGDKIDVAFLALGLKMHVDTKNIGVIKMIPYESENKYSSVTFKENKKIYTTAKGSVEVILNMSKYIIKNGRKVRIKKEEILKQNDELSSMGYRVIAVSYVEGEKNEDMIFQGLVGFVDPIRKEALSSVKECFKAGIKVLMITGDHPLTALHIGKELGILKNDEELATGLELDSALEKGEEYFDEFIKNKKVFARVTPLNKLNIVESLKRQGEFVCVTGDGVNDAPALKAANVGVSVGSGTDVAKETSNLIILDDNFKSLVEGIKEGRSAYKNIRKVCYFLLSCGVSEVLFFLMAIILNMPMPLIAIQLLWLNLVTDGLQDISLSCERDLEGIMDEPPTNPKDSIFNKKLFREILISGLTISFIVFSVWYFLINKINMDVNVARGYVMALMVFIQNVHVLNCRSEDKSIVDVPLNKNYLIIFTIIGSILLQIIVSEVDFFSKILKISHVPFDHLVILLSASLIVLSVMEVYKALVNKKSEN